MERIICHGFAGALACLAGFWLLKRPEGGAGAKRAPVAVVRPVRSEPAAARDLQTWFLRIAAGMDEIRRDGQMRELAMRWIKENPENALEFSNEQPPAAVNSLFRRHLLVAWAESDAPAALEWSDQRPGEPDRRATRETICIAVAQTDPRHALELAVGHDADQEESGSLLENLAMQWAEVDLESALAWVNEQPPGEWRDRLTARVAFVLAKSDPYTAACKVAEDMESGPEQTEAIISLLHQWAKLDRERAAAWIADFSSGQLHERALAELQGAGE